MSSDVNALRPQAEKIAGVIGKVSGVVEVKSGVQLANDALNVSIDPIRAADGHVFSVGRVATIVLVAGQPQISRKSVEPMVAVMGRIDGRGIGAAVADVRAAVDKPACSRPPSATSLAGSTSSSRSRSRGWDDDDHRHRHRDGDLLHV